VDLGRDRAHSFDYSFEPGFAQVSIKLHPNYQGLIDTYGGSTDADGSVLWPATLSGQTTSKSGLSGGKSQAEKNPMFGIEDFLRLEGEYWFRYVSVEVPASLHQGAGFIASDLPGRPPRPADGRNWLKVPPTFRRRGLDHEIRESYWLSGPGGWPLPIYKDPGTGGGGTYGGQNTLDGTAFGSSSSLR
jgi:hypothetical protein